MAVNKVRGLEDKECRKNIFFYNVSEPTTQSWKANSAHIIDICRITFDLNVEIIKLFCIGKKIDKKNRPLLIRLSNYEVKAKILSTSFILSQIYENIFVFADMTKAEQARHKLLVEQLKSQ